MVSVLHNTTNLSTRGTLASKRCCTDASLRVELTTILSKMYNLDLGIGLIVLSHVVAGHKSHVKAKLPDKSPNLALWELSAQDNVKVKRA